MSDRRNLSIPLKDSRTFDLSIPVDLSLDDFNMVIQTLNLWSRMIVVVAPSPPPKPEPIVEPMWIPEKLPSKEPYPPLEPTQ